MGAMRPDAHRVSFGRVIAQRQVGPFRLQGIVDLVFPVKGAVSVREQGSGARLVPKGQQPGAAVGMTQAGVSKVESPVDDADDHSFPGRAAAFPHGLLRCRLPAVSREEGAGIFQEAGGLEAGL